MGRHVLIRPERGAVEVLKLLKDGTWVEDDGKPGIAFSGKVDGFPFAWHPRCSCVFSDTCPGRLAADKTVKRYGASNGRERPSARKKRKT